VQVTLKKDGLRLEDGELNVDRKRLRVQKIKLCLYFGRLCTFPSDNLLVTTGQIRY